MTKEEHRIGIDQLRIGLYIHIDLGWMEHPFAFGNFKIRDEQQIAEIRKLGLKELRYDPLRSDAEPLPLPATEITAGEQTPPAVVEPPSEEEHRSFQEQRFKQLHWAIQECERKFAQATATVKSIERDILRNPPKSLDEANALVDGMVSSLCTESDVILHAMQNKPGRAEQFSHPLNVTVLALVMAKCLDMSAEDAKHLGMGGLFHDLGKSRIPDRVTRKTDPLTKAELALLQQHPEFGAQQAAEMGMTSEVAKIILLHHECADGSGYPRHLKQEQVAPLARIVALVNAYDNLCNPLDPAKAMTPYEALAHLFSRQRSKFDAELLKLLIKTLGVYPPGSIVLLSNGRYGIVMSVNPNKPLRPFVMLYAPDTPRETPMLVDLGEDDDLAITKCLHADQLPQDARNYLDPSKHISYFFDTDHTQDAS